MPSSSDAQRAFMRRAAEDPEFAKKRGIDPEVAKKFVEEDKFLEEANKGELLKEIGLESVSMHW